MSQKTVKDDDSYKAHSQAELPEASLGNAHARTRVGNLLPERGNDAMMHTAWCLAWCLPAAAAG